MNKKPEDVIPYIVGDKVVVTGKIYANGHGAGIPTIKDHAVMYIVKLVNPAKYKYYIGVSTNNRGLRQGWAKPSDITKISSTKVRSRTEYATSTQPQSILKKYEGTYYTSNRLYMRLAPTTIGKPMVALPKGHPVYCSGKFTKADGITWLYVETTFLGTKYIGYCMSNYLLQI